MAQDLELAIRIALHGQSGVQQRLASIDQAANRLKDSVARMGHALAGAFAVRELARASDAFAVAQGQVKSLSREAGAAAKHWDALFASAQRAGASIAASANLVGSLGRSAGELGANAQQVLEVAAAVQAAGALGATAAESQAGAIWQMGQMFSGTVVQAEEFGSLIDGLPVLVDAIAAGMGKTRGELIAAVKAGGVLSKDVFAAILAQAPALAAALAGAPATIARSMQRLDNAWVQFVGQSGEASGAVAGVTRAVDLLAEHLDGVATLALGGAVAALSVGVGRLAGGLGAATAGLVAQGQAARLAAAQQAAGAVAAGEAAAATELTTAAYLEQLAVSASVARVKAADLAATVAQTEAEIARLVGIARLAAVERTLIPQRAALAVASAAATQAETAHAAALAASARGAGLLRGALGLVGGPLGAIATALSLGAAAWALWGNAAADAAATARRGVESAREQLERLRQEQAASAHGGGEAGAIEARLAALRAEQDAVAQALRTTPRDTWAGGRERNALVERLRLLYEEQALLEKSLELVRARAQAGGDGSPRPAGDLAILGPKAEGLDAEFAARLAALWEAAAKEGIDLLITSGKRTAEDTARIWAAALKKYGTAAEARKHAAQFVSAHESGQAADIAIRNERERDFLARRSAEFGIAYPVRTERPDTAQRYGHSHVHAQLADFDAIDQARERSARVAQEAADKEQRASDQAADAMARHSEEIEHQTQAWKDAIDPMRVHIRALDELTARYRDGSLNMEEYRKGQALIAERMRETAEGAAGLAKKAQASGDQLTEFATQAARNMQSAFADFLFRPWEQGLGDMLRSFVDMLHRMAAEMLAQALLQEFFKALAGAGGDVGKFGESALKALVRHQGGPVMAGAGTMREAPAYLWQFAPRLHGGGVLGLAPGEVPAILQTGEQVLSRAQVAAGMGQGGGNVRIVNAVDPELARDWVESAAGERVILNIIRRNRSSVRQSLG